MATHYRHPPANHATARPLLATFAVLSVIAAVWIAIAWEPRLLPIRVVTIAGELHALSRTALQATIASQMRGGILTQDLTRLQREIQALSWVAEATVRRRWPDRLELQVRERQPLARWGEDQLVTLDGAVFRFEGGEMPSGLPQLIGADAQDAGQLVQQYLTWQPRLTPLGLTLERLQRDRRGDWRLFFTNQLEVCLGTEEVALRFERLLAAYPRLSAVGQAARLDLRYSNGIAVRWLQPNQAPHQVPPAPAAVRGERMAKLSFGLSIQQRLTE
ncbi:cell division protein FtsQ/DivIB [Thiospirillum jenense]|uniref:Cell division protein FtsQ n=1 Tax=Thiospirillum jenense TaxID=1653858 RepID=A0A839HH05_9GAMM|nr:cell division protein FtsQ/DivIB [Thiospirillum jenense]MBB1126159.1 FtsQ-type POTRA domain-containing protein [Thiospirillum jenense]